MPNDLQAINASFFDKAALEFAIESKEYKGNQDNGEKILRFSKSRWKIGLDTNSFGSFLKSVVSSVCGATATLIASTSNVAYMAISAAGFAGNLGCKVIGIALKETAAFLQDISNDFARPVAGNNVLTKALRVIGGTIIHSVGSVIKSAGYGVDAAGLVIQTTASCFGHAVRLSAHAMTLSVETNDIAKQLGGALTRVANNALQIAIAPLKSFGGDIKSFGNNFGDTLSGKVMRGVGNGVNVTAIIVEGAAAAIRQAAVGHGGGMRDAITATFEDVRANINPKMTNGQHTTDALTHGKLTGLNAGMSASALSKIHAAENVAPQVAQPACDHSMRDTLQQTAQVIVQNLAQISQQAPQQAAPNPAQKVVQPEDLPNKQEIKDAAAALKKCDASESKEVSRSEKFGKVAKVGEGVAYVGAMILGLLG